MKKIIWIIIVLVIIALAVVLVLYLRGGKASLTAEEAIKKVKEAYSEAKDMDCEADYQKDDKKWQVVCNKKDYDVGSTHYEFNYTYYLVTDENREAVKKGNYVKKWEKDGTEQFLGESRWGVPE